MNSTTAQLEALLFAAGSPVSRKQLRENMDCTDEHLEQAISELCSRREDCGIIIVDSGSHLALMTAPSAKECVERMRKENQDAPLSKAAQETLSIIAYAGPIAKVDLDFLRGVNTQYTLRRLAMRGLIRERKESRIRLFEVTVEFLSYLGLRSAIDLPDYGEIRQSVHTGISMTKKRMEEQGI